MAVRNAVLPRRGCPIYCAVDHRRRKSRHERVIAEVEAEGRSAVAAVVLVRPDEVDVISLEIEKRGWADPAVVTMAADEARELRDALNVAVALLDR